MSIDKKFALVALVWFVLGGVCGFFVAKGIYEPIRENVVRDTVRITDTIPHYYPQPVDGTVVRYVTKFLPMVRTENVGHEKFSVDSVKNSASFPHDTVAVEVPITSKHYHAKEYDAWVSGYEPSLDSIKVYRETQYITESVTISKPPNRWELDIVGGINYNFNKKKYTPHVGGELLYKPNRLQLGIQGGVEYTDKVEPVIGGVVKIRLF